MGSEKYCRRKPIDMGHIHIDQDDIRAKRPRQFESNRAVRSFADYAKIYFGVESHL